MTALPTATSQLSPTSVPTSTLQATVTVAPTRTPQPTATPQPTNTPVRVGASHLGDRDELTTSMALNEDPTPDVAKIEPNMLGCAKTQSMRWTPEGAHLLLHIRTRTLNGDLSRLPARSYAEVNGARRNVHAIRTQRTGYSSHRGVPLRRRSRDGNSGIAATIW
jgi:hypothetical protein